jgi:4-amino-4-deoxy-L-arabinose transferase-like glycosyltransferase
MAPRIRKYSTGGELTTVRNPADADSANRSDRCALLHGGWHGAGRPLVLAVLVALAIRLVVVAFQYPDQLRPRLDHFLFGYEAGRVARAIASGRGFSDPLIKESGPTAMMGPIYPFLLAGVYKVSGIYTAASAIVALSLNSLFSALTCVPVFLLARESFGERVGTFAAWTWAIFPYAVFFAVNRIWETCLTTLLLSVLFVITIYLARRARLAKWIGFGLLWGVAALTSPSVLSLLPFLGGWACYRLHLRREKWVRPVSAAALVFFLTLLPWSVRNYRTFHKLIPLRDNFWLEMWVGNHGDTSLQTFATSHPSMAEAESNEYYRLGEIAYMAEKRLGTEGFISAHPGWFVLLTLRRIAFNWTGAWSLPHRPVLETFDPDEPFDPANVIFCTALSLLAFIGLRRAFLEHEDTRWLYVFALACFPALYYLMAAHLRYRHPIDPEIVILAVYALATWRRSSGRNRPATLEH